MPEIRHITLSDGKEYREVLMLINTKNVRGTPKDVELIEMEQAIELKGGEEFMTAFVPALWLDGELTETEEV